MFSKASKKRSTPTTGSTPNKRVPPSIISEDLTITGNMKSDGEIQIDGKVIGDIQSHDLLVGDTAHITGEIVAESIRVHGKVVGQIKARNVSLAKSAHVVGDILHDNLSIETGAFLEGHCKRLAEGEFKLSVKVEPAPNTVKPAQVDTKAKASA
ncbi:bactofilin family protein [Terasakiella sp.]|uniref:bactofilin family protein n=1 Tax=Terasakiella sp. TaxID=2034861 RepID=UPI003AA8596F